VIREALDARAAEIHTAIPAKVVNYDASKQTADVQPMVKDLYHDESGGILVRSFPVLPSVPVAFLRGGGYFMTVPLNTGDTGMLIFSELPIDRWRSSGQESHPVNARRHGVGNAVFYPGVRPRAQALTETGMSDHMVLGKEGGCQVHVKPNEVNLDGGPSAQAVAIAQLVQTEFAALKAALMQALGVSSAVPSGPATGALLQAAALSTFASAYTPSTALGAQKVKAT
jgi:Phage protein Gp138 N-terminal domain